MSTFLSEISNFCQLFAKMSYFLSVFCADFLTTTLGVDEGGEKTGQTHLNSQHFE
jgi:hypothetical protein